MVCEPVPNGDVMQKYSPTTHDPGDDRKPWAVMMPNDLGAYYLVSEVEARMKRINAINDNPARYDEEIDKLSTLGKEVRHE